MKYFCVFVVFLMVAVGSVQAQQLEVRSGGHSTFSRITIALPASQNWDARQTAQSVIITLPGYSDGFNISDVFLRINRDRIAKLDATGDTLTLRMNCSCLAAAFRNGSLLVIDIADQGTKLVGRPIDGPTLTQRKRPPIINRKSSSTRLALPWIGSKSPFSGAVTSEKTAAHTTHAKDEKTSSEDHASLLRKVQKNLLVEVGNAASIGLLEGTYIPPRPPGQTLIHGTKASSVEPQILPEVLDSISDNLRITNSMDMPNGSINKTLDATSTGVTCPNPVFLSLSTWGQDTGFSAQIGPARNALMDARDHLDKEAAKTLVELYLYFGFGAEALDVLNLDPQISEAYPHLAELAAIFEQGSAEPPNRLGAFTECASDVALWASLSFHTIPPGTVIDTNAALRALNKLPIHLRLILAPALSDRLLQYGDDEAAATALRSIARLPDSLPPNAVMAQADLVSRAGDSADVLLESVIAANTTESPAALVKLVDGKLAKDEPLAAKTATLVEAYAQELRGTEIGNQLRRTQILALGQSGQFSEAFVALDGLFPSLSPQAGNQLRQAVLERLAKHAPDLTFLEHAFAQSNATIEGLPEKTNLVLASRLVDLGFAARAQEILTSVPDTPRDETRQILAARSAIMLRQPFQAQAALIGLEGPTVELLLAQAKEMSGAYREAAQLFKDNNAELRAVQAAWISEEWRDLTAPETSGLGIVTTLAQPNAGRSDLATLEFANQALVESGVARATVQELLRDPLVQLLPNF